VIARSEIAGAVVAAAVALGGLAYLYHRASEPPHAMDPGELSRITRQLGSDARESARLATLTGADQVSFNYARAQHRKIAEDVHDAQANLDVPPPRGREDDAKRLGELAGRMHDMLEATAPQLADPEAMRKLQVEHTRIAGEIERLASR
jgi:hypothetical protein